MLILRQISAAHIEDIPSINVVLLKTVGFSRVLGHF